MSIRDLLGQKPTVRVEFTAEGQDHSLTLRVPLGREAEEAVGDIVSLDTEDTREAYSAVRAVVHKWLPKLGGEDVVDATPEQIDALVYYAGGYGEGAITRGLIRALAGTSKEAPETDLPTG